MSESMIFYLPDARLLRPSGRNPLHHGKFFLFRCSNKCFIEGRLLISAVSKMSK